MNTVSNDLLQSVASTIGDYREGLQPMTPQHVRDWISQFDPAAQAPMLVELDHVLKLTYFSKARCHDFILSLVNNSKFTGGDPATFWRRVNFLGIQQLGGSQLSMLQTMDAVLRETLGFGISECGSDSGLYIYLDDAMFGGMHVIRDLSNWVRSTAAPAVAPRSVERTTASMSASSSAISATG